jgi:hypothetical protein
MNLHHLQGLMFVTALVSAPAFAATETLTLDQPMTVDGVQTVCTGASVGARADARWNAYPTRIEFAERNGQYLGDATVNITGNGMDMTVHCSGPWLLMKLPDGTYNVSADVPGEGRQSVTIQAPERIVLSFPNVNG